MEVWNEIELPIPPYSNYKISKNEIDIRKFTKILQQTIDSLKIVEQFHYEAAQLSRLIFMNCKQFRMMKGLHEMKKCHQSLLRYLKLDLVTSLEIFKGFISYEETTFCTLPYRQNLDFILIRLQGLAMLLINVVSSAKRSMTYFLGLIKAGSFYIRGTVFISTLASIWDQSREFCKHVVNHYNLLLSFRKDIKEKPGLNWIESDYHLPEDLGLWLGDKWTQNIINRTYDLKLLIKEADIAEFSKSICEKIKTQKNNRGMKKSVELSDDEMIIVNQEKIIDHSLELDDVKPIPRLTMKIHKPNDNAEIDCSHSISALVSKDSVEKFIKNESFYRKVNQMKSLTINKMKKKSWKEFQHDIKNKSVLMQEKAFIEYVKDYLEEYIIK
ncbi:CLUMA_CG011959, isoform A [Clunio marinus]|uniref:CLUMA_CG011959, isoform A n=1 Tax=Clunio marinus TaxID=568069 RepID=A0A1J1IEZ2_9DIPT|nr:CLUMA_CG011959, isoform A [Clunio marinus]